MPDLDTLSARERQVLTLYAQGLTFKEVAAKVHRSHRTIEVQMSLARERVGAKNMVQLVVMAVKAGWV